jgi:hypothetical protein
MKTGLRYLDVYMQAVLFACVMVAIILHEDVWYWLLMGQLAIGMYQLTSAAFHTASRTFKYPLNLRLNQYWIGVVLYGIVAVWVYIKGTDTVFKWLFIAGAYGLALCYFVLSWFKLVQGRMKSS